MPQHDACLMTCPWTEYVRDDPEALGFSCSWQGHRMLSSPKRYMRGKCKRKCFLPSFYPELLPTSQVSPRLLPSYHQISCDWQQHCSPRAITGSSRLVVKPNQKKLQPAFSLAFYPLEENAIKCLHSKLHHILSRFAFGDPLIHGTGRYRTPWRQVGRLP